VVRVVAGNRVVGLRRGWAGVWFGTDDKEEIMTALAWSNIPVGLFFVAVITWWMLYRSKKHHPHKYETEFSGREVAYLRAKEKLPPRSRPVVIPLPHEPASLKVYPSGKQTVVDERSGVERIPA
jgi:hypothetical protein